MNFESTLSDELRGYQIGDMDTRSVPIKPLRKFIKELDEEIDKEIKWWITDASNKEIEDADLPDRLRNLKKKIKEKAGKDLT